MAKLVYFRNGVSVFAPSDARVVADSVSDCVKPHILLGGVELKHCFRCNTWKRLSRFHVSASTWDGLQSMCVSCRGVENSKCSEARRKPKFCGFSWFEKAH
jgi:hypothetical protein